MNPPMHTVLITGQVYRLLCVQHRTLYSVLPYNVLPWLLVQSPPHTLHCTRHLYSKFCKCTPTHPHSSSLPYLVQWEFPCLSVHAVLQVHILSHLRYQGHISTPLGALLVYQGLLFLSRLLSHPLSPWRHPPHPLSHSLHPLTLLVYHNEVCGSSVTQWRQ